MPIFRLTRDLIFPPPHLADDGLLAIGGDLSLERLVLAYSSGIFPWYSAGEPILWWSPDPRAVILPGSLHLPRRLLRTLRSGKFSFSVDTAFTQVIRACAAAPRPGQSGTWITAQMIAAYERLHRHGYAHSFEAWHHGRLAGGLYGVSLGAAFFGESMFAHVPDASKAAFAMAMKTFADWEFELIDSQVMNPHMQRLGAVDMPRAEYLRRLAHALKTPTRRGQWHLEAAPAAELPPAGD